MAERCLQLQDEKRSGKKSMKGLTLSHCTGSAVATYLLSLLFRVPVPGFHSPQGAKGCPPGRNAI